MDTADETDQSWRWLWRWGKAKWDAFFSLWTLIIFSLTFSYDWTFYVNADSHSENQNVVNYKLYVVYVSCVCLVSITSL